MAFLDILSSIFKPISDIIEHITVSGDEKAKIQETIIQGQINAAGAIMDYEKQLLQAQTDIIKAEATGQSWAQRNWRPITMFVFLGLVICDSFKWLPNPLAPQAWTLLQLGLGGYVVGKSVEQTAQHVTNAIKANNNGS